MPFPASPPINPFAGSPAAATGRPPHVPESFWDPERQSLRGDVLLQAYQELERQKATPPDRGALLRALGVPESPDGYAIACDHGYFDPDPEINTRLHSAGYTPEQAQLLYDLAAERLVPMLQELACEFQAEREMERLVSHFGGEPRWREIARQLQAWAGHHLPPLAVEGLSSSFDGVLALYQMMTAQEPEALRGGQGEGIATEAELRRLMRDSRYWKERDPALIQQVTEGFRRLYPDPR